MNNIIKREFTTIGTIDYEAHDLVGDFEYALTICLNNVKERLYLGFFDPCRPDMNLNQKFLETNKYYLKDKYSRYSTPLFNDIQLRNLYNTFHKTSCPQSYIYANVTGIYVFDMDNPDNDHIEVNTVSLIDPPDVSITQSKTYTGIPVTINYTNNTAIITLDTTEITFSCPINTINSFDLTKPIVITVTEHITPTTPRKYSYTVTDVKQL